jgi:RNA polymerase sigma factor (sigma-70 family)
MQPALLSEPLRLAGAPLLRLQSDQRLVRLVRAGSHPAFSEVVHRYRPALVRYTGAIVGEQRAEDVVQQGLVNAHTALMSDDRPIELKPWLYRIVHNAALNVLRGDRDLAALDDHESELLVPSAEREAEDRERFRSTLRAVQSLPPAQRNALLLRELEGRSHDEIAVALGVTAGAARQHLMRARASMRAVATAVTPYPVLLKLAALAADSSGPLTAGAAASGAGLTLGKLGVGLLAAGAVAGGAGVVVPAVVGHAPPAAAEKPHAAPARHVRAGGTSIAARAAAPVLRLAPASAASGSPATGAATGTGGHRSGASTSSGHGSSGPGTGSGRGGKDDSSSGEHGNETSGRHDTGSSSNDDSHDTSGGSGDHDGRQGTNAGSGSETPSGSEDGSGRDLSGGGSRKGSGSGSDETASTTPAATGSDTSGSDDAPVTTPEVTAPLVTPTSTSGHGGSSGKSSGDRVSSGGDSRSGDGTGSDDDTPPLPAAGG